VILDTYTIDMPEFIEQYIVATGQKKIGMNIEKIISAINDGDYKYVYNKLDNTFKNNKFSSVENFEKYIKNNFFEKNSVEYLDFSQEGDIFIYKTKLFEKGVKLPKEKHFNIVMQLGEGTDYTMSFSFEK
jgi:hypothetical protein